MQRAVRVAFQDGGGEAPRRRRAGGHLICREHEFSCFVAKRKQYQYEKREMDGKE